MEIKTENLHEKIERWKLLSESLLKEDKQIYIKDVYGTLYFADILLVGENLIEIKCFEPEDKAGKKFGLYWANIFKLDEYKGVLE